jgi:hypothetical protein
MEDMSVRNCFWSLSKERVNLSLCLSQVLGFGFSSLPFLLLLFSETSDRLNRLADLFFHHIDESTGVELISIHS